MVLVQDVAFQLERLVAGMYIYYRQCHRSLKPAAIFPIEVELEANLTGVSKRYYSDEPEQSHDSDGTTQQLDTGGKGSDSKPVQDTTPPVDDLLLELGSMDAPLYKDPASISQ